MANLSYHKSRIVSLQHVSSNELRQIDPGYIMYIKYTNRRDETKYSMYIVLNPNDGEGHMHVLDMKYIPDSILALLVRETVDSVPHEFTWNDKKYTRLNFDGDSKVVYENTVKPALPEMRGAYKMLKFDSMKVTQLVEYKWPK